MLSQISQGININWLLTRWHFLLTWLTLRGACLQFQIKKKLKDTWDAGRVTLYHLYHNVSHLFVYLSVWVYLYAEHIWACMHTQCGELPALASLLYHSSPWFVTLPSPSTVQSSQALGTAWGEQHVWLPGTPEQQHPTPYAHSIYRKHYPAHTQHWIIPFASRISWIFFIGRKAKETKS